MKNIRRTLARERLIVQVAPAQFTWYGHIPRHAVNRVWRGTDRLRYLGMYHRIISTVGLHGPA